MNANNFADRLRQAQKEIDDFISRKAPVIVGNMAVEHFRDNFRKGGFVDRSLEKWKPAKRQGVDGGAATQYGPLLSSRNHLYRSLIYRPGVARVVVTTTVVYAPVHNEGGVIHPTVTARMRKLAWRNYYEAGGGQSKDAEDPPEARKWKALALTKKQKLSIRIPQRKFIGQSEALTKKIQDKIDAEITKLLKL